MITRRPDLNLLRLLLVALALTIGLVATSPGGASAAPNTGQTPAKTKGQMDCEWAGGTWTVVTEGVKATCTGLGKDRDYSCNLKVGPNGTACSHLSRKRVSASPSTDRTFGSVSTSDLNLGVVQTASADGTMAPLDR